MNTLKTNEGAGDLPEIPIGPIQSYNQDQERISQIAHCDDRGKPIESHFDFHEIIGSGGFSKVKRATHKTTGDTYAVKILDKSKIKETEFPLVILEIETLSTVSHPCICKLYSAFYTSTRIYMVMEYCYTDLFEYLVKLKKPMTEVKGRRIFMQLLSAVSYLHGIGIVHRDIKPENILLANKMRIKLCDFGFSSKIPQLRKQLLSTYCGSLAYGAPEVILGTPYCGVKADIWSLGANLFVILTNRQPFSSRNPNELKTQIVCGRFQVHPCLSKKALNLIRRLLTVLPERRPTTQEIWQDPWIKEDMPFLLSLKQECGPLRPINSAEKMPGSSSSLIWFHRPVHRSEPVQAEKATSKSKVRWFFHSTRKKFQKLRNLFS